jgi:hypothetical protein
MSENFGVDHLAQTALSKIQSVCTRYSNATNSSLSANFTQEEINRAKNDFKYLQVYFDKDKLDTIPDLKKWLRNNKSYRIKEFP